MWWRFCLFLLLATHENIDIFFAYIKIFYLSLGGAFPPCFPSLKKQMFSKPSGKGTYHMGIHVWAGGLCEGWLPGRFCRLGLMVPCPSSRAVWGRRAVLVTRVGGEGGLSRLWEPGCGGHTVCITQFTFPSAQNECGNVCLFFPESLLKSNVKICTLWLDSLLYTKTQFKEGFGEPHRRKNYLKYA